MALIGDVIANLWPKRRASAVIPPQAKASATGALIAIDGLRQPVWAPRDYSAFAREGFAGDTRSFTAVSG